MNETIYLDPSIYPELCKRQESPFVKELIGGKGMPVNGNFMPHALWNMIITKRNLSMWVNLSMKPNRNWKVSQVKEYFDIKGRGQKLLERFEKIEKEVKHIYNIEE